MLVGVVRPVASIERLRMYLSYLYMLTSTIIEQT